MVRTGLAAQSSWLFYRENPAYSRPMILIGTEEIIHHVTATRAACALAGIVGASATPKLGPSPSLAGEAREHLREGRRQQIAVPLAPIPAIPRTRGMVYSWSIAQREFPHDRRKRF
jgi:hypothetical protein